MRLAYVEGFGGGNRDARAMGSGSGALMDGDRRHVVGEGTCRAGVEGAFHTLGELSTIVNDCLQYWTGTRRTYEASDPSASKGTSLECREVAGQAMPQHR